MCLTKPKGKSLLPHLSKLFIQISPFYPAWHMFQLFHKIIGTVCLCCFL